MMAKRKQSAYRAKRFLWWLLRLLPDIITIALLWAFQLLVLQRPWRAVDLAVSVALLIAGRFLATRLAVLTHELGHLLLGQWTGHRFIAIGVRPYTLVRLDGGKARLTRYSLPYAIGYCTMAPPLIGGAAANALCALIAVVLFFACPWFHLRRFLVIFFVWAAWGALWNLVRLPVRWGAISDGQWLHLIASDPGAKYTFWAGAKVRESEAKGVRLRDMPPEWFEVPEGADLSNAAVLSLACAKTQYEEDRHHFDAARAEAERLLDALPEMPERSLYALKTRILFCELVGECRRGVLEAMWTPQLQRYLAQRSGEPETVRVQYAVARLLLRNQRKIDDFKARFARLEATYPYPVVMRSERELMDIIDARRVVQKRPTKAGPLAEVESQWIRRSGGNVEP